MKVFFGPVFLPLGLNSLGVVSLFQQCYLQADLALIIVLRRMPGYYTIDEIRASEPKDRAKERVPFPRDGDGGFGQSFCGVSMTREKIVSIEWFVRGYTSKNPIPLPGLNVFLNIRFTNLFADKAAFRTPLPFANSAARAAENVQPVP